jgi:NAD(P)-dependent dehydrogenase (short-subunit alcohol dehydrogenase family)
MEFEGRVFIITGAASGMGRATAGLCAARGATVAAVDVSGAAAEETAAAIRAAGGTARAYPVDVQQDAQIRAMVGQVVEAFGRVDVLANIAGITLDAAFEDTTDEIWERVINTNLRGPFYLCRAVLPTMKRRRAGSIINTGSGAAYNPWNDLTAYSASKGGLIAMTRVLAFEAAPFGIRANVVAPGPTNTPMMNRDGVDRTGLPVETWRIPLNRLGEPEDIAEAVAFLASDQASFITGQVLHVNGGRYMSP